MKPQFALRCWLVLLLIASAIPVRAEDSAKTNAIQWGAVTNELQLGVQLNPDELTVNCWLRNPTAYHVKLNTCALGRSDSLRLFAEFDGQMKPLRRHPATWVIEGIGPSAYGMADFGPGWVLQTTASGDYQRASAKADRKPSAGEGSALPEKPSFKMPLLDFGWPKEVLTNQFVSIQVCETLYRDKPFEPWWSRYPPGKIDEIESFEVRSAKIAIDTKELSAALSKSPQNWTTNDDATILREFLSQLKFVAPTNR